VIDGIVPEPLGGAHRDPAAAIAATGTAIAAALEPLLDVDGPELKRMRRDKFLRMGKTGL
jgi:acetyl-CoA carboxylase carboxyl transferase subunit alpha